MAGFTTAQRRNRLELLRSRSDSVHVRRLHGTRPLYVIRYVLLILRYSLRVAHYTLFVMCCPFNPFVLGGVGVQHLEGEYIRGWEKIQKNISYC